VTRTGGRLIGTVVVVALLVAAVGLWGRQRIVTPYKAFEGAEVFVDLPPGTSVSGIADRLAAAGVIPDAFTFRLAARWSGADRRLKAGEYRFASAATPREVIARLVAGDVFTRSVTFPEGLTIVEMSEIFERSTLGSASDFVLAASETALAEPFDPQARSLEGFLFPDTYMLPRGTDADATVRAMVARFGHAFDGELRAAAAARRMTPRQVLTLASLIEKETGKADERTLVSAVYHNRLRLGMPLQCDPTVIYALMLARRWNGNLRRVDLEMDSPYNTYVTRGLPPGPIASPGLASLHAAVHPADVKYLYFVSRNDGSHVFANTLSEHNRNVNTFQKKQGQKSEGRRQK
jgi:UPF0755 protein